VGGDPHVERADRLAPALQLRPQRPVRTHRIRAEGRDLERRPELLQRFTVAARTALGRTEAELGTGDRGDGNFAAAPTFEVRKDLRRAPIDPRNDRPAAASRPGCGPPVTAWRLAASCSLVPWHLPRRLIGSNVPTLSNAAGGTP